MRTTTSKLSVRVLSHNIRYATDSPFPGELPWSDRLPLVAAQLKYHTRHCPTAFVCLQEVLHGQLNDLLDSLNKHSSSPEWAYIGVGRDDGKEAGEYSPIFYRPAVWKLDHFKTIWLSETPDVPSKGWDAASVRLVTVGLFMHRESKQRLVVMSTHLDDQGTVARREAAKILLKEAGHWCAGPPCPSMPVVLAGDMNSADDQDAYQRLNSAGSPVVDIMDTHPAGGLYGYRDTFTGFNGQGDGEGLKRIDFLFCGPRRAGGWEATGYAVLANCFDGVYLSDHRAIVGDMELWQTQSA